MAEAPSILLSTTYGTFISAMFSVHTHTHTHRLMWSFWTLFDRPYVWGTSAIFAMREIGQYWICKLGL